MRSLWPFVSALACASVMLACLRLMRGNTHADPGTTPLEYIRRGSAASRYAGRTHRARPFSSAPPGSRRRPVSKFGSEAPGHLIRSPA